MTQCQCHAGKAERTSPGLMPTHRGQGILEIACKAEINKPHANSQLENGNVCAQTAVGHLKTGGLDFDRES